MNEDEAEVNLASYDPGYDLEAKDENGDYLYPISRGYARIPRPGRMGAVKNEPPMGRRAAIEHTKRKNADE